MKIDGRYLKDLRDKNGLSLREFAKRVYASKSSVQRWEKSSPPDDSELIERIAAVYSLTVTELKTQSDAKYGAGSNDKLSPEKLAELKFGVKWLIIPLTVFAVAAIVILFLTI